MNDPGLEARPARRYDRSDGTTAPTVRRVQYGKIDQVADRERKLIVCATSDTTARRRSLFMAKCGYGVDPDSAACGDGASEPRGGDKHKRDRSERQRICG